jgi:ATP-binding cassette, subfamily B, bacterial HlyB/CyaB
VAQTDIAQDTSLLSLAMVARHHGVDLGVDRIAHDYAIGLGATVGTTQLLRIAKENGFKAKLVTLDWDDLAKLDDSFPLIARLANGNSVILAGFRPDPQKDGGGEAMIVDPLAKSPTFIPLSRDTLLEQWRGETVFLKRIHKLADENQPFGLRWFIPEVLKQRPAFLHVATAGLLLHGIGLVTPLFFQVVIDKVLVHNSYDTLTVLGIGVSVAVAFEALIGFLRNYLLLHTTNKIDIRLSTRIFNHLVRLPVWFFEGGSAGVTVQYMQQIERVREFLTGKLFSTVLDSWALLVFLPILVLYSPLMAGIVLLFSFMVGVTVLLIMPYFRRELMSLYKAEGERQSLLVETIHGMSTVKALAMEPALGRRWADSSALAITMQMRVGRVSQSARAIIALVEKLLTVAIVWVGAVKVFDGDLSVGELIAIQMLAGRVSGPLVQLVSLVNEFQQTGLSVRMLGEIMNRKPEASGGNRLRPPLKGGIALDGVSFTYPGITAPALDGVTLDIPPGTFVGVVGRSGSGKTTFLRLLQGMYQPATGHLRYDGIDIRELDLAHLRRSLGVVLQESFIFKGTVREAISATDPGAAFEDVVLAAQMAGADEFIQCLPQGYDTILEENAANLSGGQKQRLAIARSLLGRPPILILDEATSALDPESEAIVQANMARIIRGRTLISVSHRLSTLVGADFIVVFDRGRIVASAPHARLLETCDIYRQLWRQQSAAHRAGGVA